jgi:hypothetical protein
MPNLESVVRPYAIQGVNPPKPQVEGPNAPEQAILEFGGSGASVFTVALSAFTEVVTIEPHREISRTFDVVRVKNPDDPKQFVDVESLRKVTLQNVSTGAKREITYAEQQADANTEFVKRNQIRTTS